MYTHGAIVLCMLVVGSASSPRSDYSGYWIQPYTYTEWGDWGIAEWCPHGTFAKEFGLKIEEYLGETGDDSAVNGIKLNCRVPDCRGPYRSGGWIESLPGPYGTYSYSACPYGYVIVGAQAKSLGSVGSGYDDVAVTNYKFKCRHMTNGRTQTLSGCGPYPWGYWNSMRTCPSGTAICGLKTQVEPGMGHGHILDDTALNDAKFYCCNLPTPCHL